jgi:hypothetical protein
MSRIKAVLAPSGTLSGYIIIEPDGGTPPPTWIRISQQGRSRSLSYTPFQKCSCFWDSIPLSLKPILSRVGRVLTIWSFFFPDRS